MRKLAVAMAKGGVGKTTTAIHLAHGLARAGRRVVLIDGDTQGQTALFLGVKPELGLAEFITGRDRRGQPVNRQDCLHPARPNLWLLAGGIGLVELKYWLGEQPRETRQAVLRHALVPRGDSVDYLIFDCAPGWDLLSVNILMAATEVLCPVALQMPALEGLNTFFGYLLSAQSANRELRLRYVLPTLFDRRTRHGGDVLTRLDRFFRRQLCEPIRHSIRLAEAAGHGKTIFEFDERSVAAEDYARLVRRLLDDDGSPEPPPPVS